MKSYVYTITLPSGRVYVGKANNPQQRWRQHKRLAAAGRKSALYNALRKYPDVKPVVVFSSPDEAGAFWAETWLIERFREAGEALNCTDGGEGTSGLRHTEASKSQMSRAKKGRVFTEEHRAKLAAARRGKSHSAETRQKMSNSQKGREFSIEHKTKLSENSKWRKPASS